MSIMDNKVSKSGDTMTGNLQFPNATGLRLGTAQNTGFLYKLNSGDVAVGIKTKDNSNFLQSVGFYADGTAKLFNSKQNADNTILAVARHGSNYVRLGNGLQICWGNSPVNQTITFQQPFKDAGYKVTFCQTNNAEHNINNTAVDKTTTSFKFNRGYQGDWIAIGWWY